MKYLQQSRVNRGRKCSSNISLKVVKYSLSITISTVLDSNIVGNAFKSVLHSYRVKQNMRKH